MPSAGGARSASTFVTAHIFCFPRLRCACSLLACSASACNAVGLSRRQRQKVAVRGSAQRGSSSLAHNGHASARPAALAAIAGPVVRREERQTVRDAVRRRSCVPLASRARACTFDQPRCSALTRHAPNRAATSPMASWWPRFSAATTPPSSPCTATTIQPATRLASWTTGHCSPSSQRRAAAQPRGLPAAHTAQVARLAPGGQRRCCDASVL